MLGPASNRLRRVRSSVFHTTQRLHNPASNLLPVFAAPPNENLIVSHHTASNRLLSAPPNDNLIVSHHPRQSTTRDKALHLETTQSTENGHASSSHHPARARTTQLAPPNENLISSPVDRTLSDNSAFTNHFFHRFFHARRVAPSHDAVRSASTLVLWPWGLCPRASTGTSSDPIGKESP